MDQPLPLDALPETDEQEEESWESAMLREHAELAMTLCRRIVKQAEDADWLGLGGDTAFARISHAMQVSLTLKRKLEAEAAQERRRAAREAAEAAKAQAAEANERAVEAKKQRDEHHWRVRKQVEAAIDATADAAVGRGIAVDRTRLRLRLNVRLADLDVTREIEGRPVSEVVAGICRELGVPPPGDVVTAEAIAAAATGPAETVEARQARREAQAANIAAMGARLKDHLASNGHDPPDG